MVTVVGDCLVILLPVCLYKAIGKLGFLIDDYIRKKENEEKEMEG